MRMFLGLLFFLGISSAANAEPKCISYPKSTIPPEVRVQVWNQFLQDNPKTEHREKILKEIEQALGEMWGKPECDALLRDATVNPFQPYTAKKSPPQNTPPSSRDDTIDPFHTQDGMLVDPFKKKAPPQSSSLLPDEDGTYNPFPPSAGPKGPKKSAGNFTVDPWETPTAKTPEAPSPIGSDDVLVDPFRKKKNK